MRRAILPVSLLLLLWIYLSVGFLRIPEGMDTLPKTHPPGSLCLIDKRRGSVAEGAVVFVDVRGGTLLSRVVERSDGLIRMRHDNPDSELPDEELGAVTLDRVRGTVLAVFPPEPDIGSLPDGR